MYEPNPPTQKKATIAKKPFLMSSPFHSTHPQKYGGPSSFHSFNEKFTEYLFCPTLCTGHLLEVQWRTKKYRSCPPRAHSSQLPACDSREPFLCPVTSLFLFTVTTELSLVSRKRLLHSENCSVRACCLGLS